MFEQYIDAAIQQAQCEYLPDEQGFYCEVPVLQGIWATAETADAALAELRSVVQEWVALGLAHDHTIPVLDGIDLNRQQFQHA